MGGIDGATLSTSLAAAAFDLVVDSYLLAHLEHPRRAIQSMAALVAPAGTLVLELDYLLATVEGGQWDAIRHGHQTYLALGWVVEELRDRRPRGGRRRAAVGLRRRTSHLCTGGREAGQSVEAQLAREATAGIDRPLASSRWLMPWSRPDARWSRICGPAGRGRLVAGYGAPARSVTFLNALGIGPDLLPYTRRPGALEAGADGAGRPDPHPGAGGPR